MVWPRDSWSEMYNGSSWLMVEQDRRRVYCYYVDTVDLRGRRRPFCLSGINVQDRRR
jgi:hypothetical protein